PRVTGKRRTQFALARIVFQRRLASSLGAITSSLVRRHKRFAEMLAELEKLLDETLVAETIERLREEVDELARLVELARKTLASGKEAKLEALEACLNRAEFAELKDGRGKLLIFTEHKDTLDHLLKKL